MDRKSGIGGSECAAAIGLSRWKTPYSVWLEKTSDEEINIDNDAMRWGRALEPLILKEYQERTGKSVSVIIDSNGFQKKITSEKYPWLYAHVDAIDSIRPIIIEAKSTHFFGNDWGDEGTDKIPIEYLIQCAHYCIVMDDFEREITGKEIIEGVDIAALGSTSDFRIYHYKRNEKLEKKIIELTGKFWNENVLSNSAPQPTNKDNLSKVYQDCINGNVIADNQMHELCTELKDVKASIKILEEKEERIKSELQLRMKEKDTLIDTSGNILATWKASETKRLNQKMLKENGIDLTDYYDVTTTRRFLVK